MEKENIQANATERQTIFDENSLSVRVILAKFLVFLPYFIVSVFIAITFAYFINRYATPRFALKTTILIKDKGRNSFDGSETFLQGSSLINASKNIENEIGIIKSRFLVEQTINNLNFGISYYYQGKVKTSEQYPNAQFIVEMDTNHLQPYGVPIYIHFLANNEVELSSKNKSGSVLIPYNEEKINNVSGAIPKQKFNLNQEIKAENFKFKIILLDPSLINDDENIYYFVLNTKTTLVNQYAGSYGVKPINKTSSIVEITKESGYPEKDVVFLNKLGETYINMGLEEKTRISKNTVNFITDQINDIQDSLNYIEDNLQSFRAANKIVNISDEGKYIMEKLTSIEKNKAIEESKLNYYNYLSDYISKNKKINEVIAPSSMGIGDPLLNSLILSLSELYVKRITLQNSMESANPALAEIDNDIQNIKQTLVENVKNIKKQSQIVIEDYNKQVGEIEKELNILPNTERQLLNLNRKFTISDKLYTYLLEKRAEAGIAGASVVADNKFVDRTIVTGRTYPKASNNYLIALLIGILIPAVIISSLEAFNTKINNHKQLQAASSIPLIGNIIHNVKKNPLVIQESPKSSIAESFRNLRSNLGYFIKKQEKQVILVTSTVSGEGKTFVSMNLASVIAISGAKTILLGVDLRKPKIFQDFKLDNSIGLTNYLIGRASKEQIIQKTKISSLDVITAGPTPPNPSELLIADRFFDLLLELKKEYEYIILDTPPIGLVADGLDLMKYSDIILYIVRQRLSRKNYLNLINDVRNSDKTKNIGLVFNDVNFAPIYGYGYTYGYGYGYGYGYAYGYGYGYSYGANSSYSYGDNIEVDKKPFWKKLLGY